MLTKLENFFLKNTIHFPFVKQKLAKSFLYYLISGWVLLPFVYISIILLIPEEIFLIVPSLILVLVMDFLCLVLLRIGRYNVAANLMTFLVLAAVLIGVIVRLHVDPQGNYYAGLYLLLVVIIQAAVFCSPISATMYSIAILIINIVIYFLASSNMNEALTAPLRLALVYVSLAVVVITILLQLLINIFNNATSKLENELRVNVEQFMVIEDLNQKSEVLEKEYGEIRDVSLSDALTGLRNRRFLDEVLKDEVENFIQQKERVSESGYDSRDRNLSIYGIFFVDLDFFKKVNDQYGHKAGDMVLRQISGIFLSAIRMEDVVIRWGGEEFLIILKNTKQSFLPVFAERIRHEVEGHSFVIEENKTIQKTCSIGYAFLPAEEGKLEDINLYDAITFADLALYYSKETGRNRWTGIESIKLNSNSKERSLIFSSLQEAVDRNIVTIRTGPS